MPERSVLAVCATGIEAWGVRRRAPGVRVVQVGVGGAAPADGAPIVISAGLCGGLMPDQRPGTVVVASTVADEAGTLHTCDPGVVASLRHAAEGLGLPVATGPVVTTRAMVTGADRAAWAARGLIAVDMESSRAAAGGGRFGVLRVILDAPRHELSPDWANPARAIRHPSNWVDAVWLAISGPRYALRAGAVLAAAVFSDVDAEV